MKKTWIVVLAAGMISAVTPALLTRAEEGGMGAEHMERRHHHGFADLTDDQKGKLKDISRAERKALRPLFDKQRDLMDALSDQVEDKASDADLQKTLSAIKTNRAALRDQMSKFRDQKEAVFTPQQKAEMLLMRHREGFGHEHMGMWGHGGGWGEGGHAFRGGRGEGRDE